jgi:hypothetical protein
LDGTGNRVQISFVQEGEIKRAEAFLRENYKSLSIKILNAPRLGQVLLSSSSFLVLSYLYSLSV